MKLCTFDLPDGVRHIGAVIDAQRLVDLTAAGHPMFQDMLALIDAGESGLDAARQEIGRAHV